LPTTPMAAMASIYPSTCDKILTDALKHGVPVARKDQEE
jgi:hypothetical protein